MAKPTYGIRLSVDDKEAVERALREIGEGGQAALKKIERAGEPASRSLQSLDAVTGSLHNSWRGLGQSLGVVGAGLSALGPAGIAVGAGIAAVGAAAVSTTKASADFEQSMFRLDALIKSTGFSAGLTADQINDFARQLAQSTLASAQGVREASAQLLTFRTIGGSVFFDTLTVAQDLAAVMGGDLRSKVNQLGKALEDPVRQLSALRESGISFSAEQETVIKNLAETNRLFEAQSKILEIISGQLGGAGKGEGQGLIAQWKAIEETIKEALERVGQISGVKDTLTKAISEVNEYARGVSDSYLTDEGERERLQQFLNDLDGRAALNPRIRQEDVERIRAEAEAELAEVEWRLAQKRAEEEIAASNRVANIAAERRSKEEAIEKALAAQLVLIGEQTADLEKSADVRRVDALVLQNMKALGFDLSAGQKEQLRAALAQQVATDTRLKAEKKAAAEREKQENTLKKQIAQLEIEADLAGVTAEERARIVALMRAAEVAGRDLTAEEERRIEAAIRLRDETEKSAEASREAAQEMSRIYERAFDNIQDYGAQRVRAIFQEGRADIADFGDFFKDVMLDATSEVFSARLIRPLTESVFGGFETALFGAAGGDGGGAGGPGGGGLFGAVGTSLAGSAIGKSISSLGIGAKLLGTAATDGAAATSGLIGSGGNLFGLSGVGAGAALAGAGLAAAVILPKLFESSSVGPNAGGQLRFEGNRFFVGPTGADNGGNVAGVEADLAAAAKALNILTSYDGFSVAADKTFGGADNPIAGFLDTFRSGGIGDADGLVRWVIEQGIIAGLTAAEKSKILASDNVGQGIADVLNIRNGAPVFVDNLNQSILDLTDPKAGALARLDAEMAALREAAQEFGVFDEAAASIERLGELRLDEIMERFGEAAEKAAADFDNAVGTIDSFLSRQTASIGSPLSGDAALANARAEFDRIVSQAETGGAGAIDRLTPEIIDVGERLLSLSRAQNASSPEFFRTFNEVNNTLRELRAVLDNAQGTDLQFGQAEQTNELRAIRRELQALREENANLTSEMAALRDRIAA